jgi:cytochrome c biogenesis protein CcdA
VSDGHGCIEEEEAMAFAGLAITFLGFLVAVGSLGISNSNTVRGVIVLVGIVVSLVGIMGVTNQAYLKNAIWKK